MASVQRRYENASKPRDVQLRRGFHNAQFPPAEPRLMSVLDDQGERTLELAVRRMNLFARAHDQILRIAGTVADFDHAERVSAKQLAEAVRFRNLDRNHWS